MWNSISRLINPNFKPSQNGQKRKFKEKKRPNTGFNKVRKFKDKKKFKEKKRPNTGFNKKRKFKEKKKKFGFTNNPKYFDKKLSNNLNRRPIWKG